VDLAQRLVLTEPVERLADGDGVDVAIRERHPLGGAGEDDDAAHVLLELLPHLAYGLDCDHVGAARHEQPRQLAGSRSEVEHGAARTQVETRDETLDGRRGIAGPSTLVDVGAREAARRGMQIRHGRPRSHL